MLYQVISRLIDRGAVDGLRGKVDVLYTFGRLTDEEYQTLVERL
ncbi:MAG: hypothetical protein VB104_07555 [Candidatus Limiplasma sp.]|nr:hypothetical protein [Candidatus Limiplasma sp.]